MDTRKRGTIGTGFAILLAASVFLLATAGCGGGSSGTATSGATVNVSMAATSPNTAPSLQGASATGLPAFEPSAATPAADNIDNVWVTVRRVALIPGGGDPGPDPNGEMSVEDASPRGASGLLSADLDTPEEVDLLHLPAEGLARFLNAIANVPAGTYGKIRLYYSDPKVHFIGATDNTVMHGTANFHLDIHFVGGNLVIPESTDGMGVQFHDVTVVFVLGKRGLKITVTGGGKILMRPQVFATVSTVRYVLTGTVDNVDKVSSTFDLATLPTESGRVFHVDFADVPDNSWAFRESGLNPRAVAIDNRTFAIEALNNGATADAIGVFSDDGLFHADQITITFPVATTGAVVSGTATSGWTADNTFELDNAIDNVVIPKPSRAEARYDDNTALSPLVNRDAAIVNGVFVIARGYPGTVTGEVQAYWISVVP